MELKQFKELEKKVKKPDFGEDFKVVNIILKVASILGNFASIFLASFFVTELLAVAIETPLVYWVITIISLSILELSKREIFFRFSRDFIRTKKIFSKAVFPMLFFTGVLISLSFYSSLSGAKEFSSKSDQIEVVAEQQIDNFADSTANYYQQKIELLEQQNADLFAANQRIDQQIQDLLDEHPTWTNSAKRLRDGKEPNTIQIEKNDAKIKEIKEERDEVIEKYKKEVESESSEDIEKNKSDSYIFIATSTIIEFLILLGIYFSNVYNFRTYRDTKKKIISDDNFRTYYEYTEIIEVLYLNRKEKDKVPDKKLMLELLHMNKVYLREDQLESALKLFDALKIIETNGDITYLVKEKNEAEKLIKEHFHIK
jgi:hypothetical protein